jgi:hypothetical protein
MSTTTSVMCSTSARVVLEINHQHAAPGWPEGDTDSQVEHSGGQWQSLDQRAHQRHEEQHATSDQIPYDPSPCVHSED